MRNIGCKLKIVLIFIAIALVMGASQAAFNPSQPGCYSRSGALSSPGTLSVSDFDSYYTPDMQKQSNPDDSSAACSCLSGRSWTDAGTCCGDDNFDCGKIVQGSLCSMTLDSISAAWLSASADVGEINYVGCNAKEYLAKSNGWVKCDGSFWKNSVGQTEYICIGQGKGSIVECCGSGQCQSSADGRRLSTGQSVVPSQFVNEGTPQFDLYGGRPINPPSGAVYGADVSFDQPGTFFQPVNGNSRLDFRLPVAAGESYKKVTIDFDLHIANFPGEEFNGAVIDMTRPEGGSYFGAWVQSAKSKTSVEILSGGGLSGVERPWKKNMEYHINVVYDIITNDMTFNAVNKATGEQMAPFTRQIRNRDIRDSGRGLFVGFGLPKIMDDGRWYPPYGWAFSNLQVKLLNQGLGDPTGNCPGTPLLCEDSSFQLCVNGAWRCPIDEGNQEEGPPDTDCGDVWCASGLSIPLKSSSISAITGLAVSDPVVNANTYYCASDKKFVTNLDTPNSQATCEGAGLTWTGTKCCSEADDFAEFYNDPNGRGGCWNKNPMLSISIVPNTLNSVINFNGTFHGCAIDKLVAPNKTSSAYVFQQQGMFHKPTSQNMIKEFNLNVPQKPYSNIMLDFDVKHGGYNTQNPGKNIHGVFWLYRDRFRSNTFAEVVISGPANKFIKMKTNFDYPDPGVPPGGTISINKEFITGQTYHYHYEYDAKTKTISLKVTNNGQEYVRVPLPATIQSDTFQTSGSGFRIAFGNQVGTEGPETPSIGWEYANLKIEFSNESAVDIGALINLTDTHTGAKLITNHDYCFSDPGRSYYCSTNGAWLSANLTDRSHKSSAPFRANSSQSQIGCCAAAQCWDGSSCINNQKNEPLAQPLFGRYRCVDGKWMNATLKFTPDRSMSGYCPDDSQCLLNPRVSDPKEQCIGSTNYSIDNYCENGNWTTRTKLLAVKLLEIRNGDFTLFCDSRENALNDLTYLVGGNTAESVLNALGANNFCMLKNADRTIIAVSVNNQTTGNLSVFGIANCNNAQIDDGKYHPCDNTNKVWFNKRLKSFIYSPKAAIVLPDSDRYSFFNMFINEVMKNIISSIKRLVSEPPFDESYLQGITKFDKLYLSVKGTRSVAASMEGRQFVNLVAEYWNFESDLCSFIDKYNEIKKDVSSGISCRKEGNNYVVLAQGSSFSNVDPDKVWTDLTSELRLT